MLAPFLLIRTIKIHLAGHLLPIGARTLTRQRVIPVQLKADGDTELRSGTTASRIDIGSPRCFPC